MSSNPLRWSYETLVESFDVYHAGAEPPKRELLDFSQQLASFRPEKKAFAQKAKMEKFQVPEVAQVAQTTPPASSSRPEKRSAAKKAKADRVQVSKPKALEASPALGSFPGMNMPDNEADMEQMTPEQYSEWMKYYRECVEYFQQCERNCAEQAGIELPKEPRPGTMPTPSTHKTHEKQPRVESFGPFGAQMPEASSASYPPFPFPGKAQTLDIHSLSSLMPPPLPEGATAAAPLLQALQAVQLLQQQQQLQQLQLQAVQQLISGSLLSHSMLGMPSASQSAGNALGLNNETLMNLLIAWYYSGYYTGEYAAKQGKMWTLLCTRLWKTILR